MSFANLLAVPKWLEGIGEFFGEFLWGLFKIFFLLLDWLQSLFRSLAGLESMNINGQAVNASADEPAYDIVYYLIGSDIVIDIFVSMIVFGMILLVVMTILAIIRNTYQDKQKPISSFIYDSFKGLLGFLLVPIACVVGLMFSNVILQLVDSATSYGNSSSMSTNLFMACSYDANVFRNGTDEKKLEHLNRLIDETNFEEYDNGVVITYITSEVNGDYNALTEEHYDRLADYLDEAFTGGFLQMKNGEGKTLDIYKSMSYSGLVFNSLKINYFILIVCGSLILGIFIKMCYGLIGRIFKLVIDFVIIPVVLAMMPFDGGSAVKSWKGDFVKNVTMSYATVGAINLYFSILPVIEQIEFNHGFVAQSGWFNAIFTLALQIIGINVANSIIKTISGWFGTGDILSEGESAQKAFKDGWNKIRDDGKKTIKNVTGLYGGAVGGAKAAGSGFWNKATGAIKGAAAGTGFTKNFEGFSIAKGMDAGRKAGKDYVTEGRTTRIDLSPKGKTPRAELAKAKIAIDKDYDDVSSKIKAAQASIMADPTISTADKGKEIAKAAKQIRLNSQTAAALKEKGSFVDTAGNSYKFADEYSALERRTKANEKRKANKDRLDSFVSARSRAKNAYNNVIRAGFKWAGRNPNDLIDFINNRKIPDLSTGGYNHATRNEILRYFNEMIAAEEEAKSLSYQAMMAYESLGGSKTMSIDGKKPEEIYNDMISNSIISAIVDSSGNLNTTIDDIETVADDAYNKVNSEAKNIKNREDELENYLDENTMQAQDYRNNKNQNENLKSISDKLNGK